MWFVLLPLLTTLTADARNPGRKQVESMQEGCKRGDSAVCVDLADAHTEGRGKWLPQDARQARQYLQRACSLQSSTACVRIADDLRERLDRPRPADLKRIVDLYEQACRFGDQESCREVSRTVASWSDVLDLSPQVERMRHQTGCDAGDDAACTRVQLVDALKLDPSRFEVALDEDAGLAYHKTIAEMAPELRGCYQSKLDLNHRMEGRLGLRVALGSRGEVVAQEITEDSARDTELAQCVNEVVQRTTFPPSTALVRLVPLRFDLRRWGSYVRPLETANYLQAQCEQNDADACSALALIEPTAVHLVRNAEATVLVAELEPHQVGDVIGRQRTAIDDCYRDGLLRNRTLAGSVTLRFAVERTGVVSTAIVERSTLGDGGVESCLRRLVRSQAFPAPKGGGVAIAHHTIELDPEQID